jgi:5-methyltetrahydrofolate--homocysteine methyltransferase
MATVKGDVHDIGKNIVGVVLGCNGYEVIDLGVMVPADKILHAAKEHGAQAIGLSGLITPSLEEMSHFAAEMKRNGMDVPLLIGGATTSRAHTALKIAPNYDGPVVYVPDASRAVGVVTKLLSIDMRDGYVAEIAADYEKARAQHANKKGVALLTLAAARANAAKLDYAPAKPNKLGVTVLKNLDLAEIAKLIDWTPFFQTWDLAGRFPQILDDATVGEAARNVFRDAQAMLGQIIEEDWLTANAVFGLFPVTRPVTNGEDIAFLSADGKALMTWHGLRQQQERPEGKPQQSLADFVAPSGDYAGAFAVTAGLGIEKKLAEFEAQHDDYRSIMLKSLADRLAEAAAEWLHREVRSKVLGLCGGRNPRQCRADRREVHRHPPGARLPGLPRPYGQGRPVQTTRRRSQCRHAPHREFRHDAGGFGGRLLSGPPRGALFRHQQDRSRPA